MNVTCGSVIIDTEGDHESHKKAVRGKSDTGLMCERSSPKQFFTQQIDGYQRFYELFYNKSGDTLKKIEYWDKKKDSERKRNWTKLYDSGDCYFSRNGKEGKFEWRSELDWWDLAHPHVTIWKRHWWN